MTDVTDDFPSGSLAPNWTGWGGTPVVAGGVFTHTGSTVGNALWTGDDFDNDQYAEVKLAANSGGSFWGVVLRASGASLSAGNCYLCTAQNELRPAGLSLWYRREGANAVANPPPANTT